MRGIPGTLWTLCILLAGPGPAAIAQESSAPRAAVTSQEEEVVDLDAMEEEPERAGGLLDRFLPENSPIRLFGYGEAHFNDPKPGTMSNRDDAITEIHRFVIGLGYDFSEKLHMEVEVDFEHSFEDPEVEFAHVTLDLSESFHLRAGSVLVPVGFMNEMHEPPTFYSVERPQVDTLLIPTTWQEVGAGVLGEVGSVFSYRAYLLAGLDAFDDDPARAEANFTPLTGIRGGRTKTQRGQANDLAGVVRVEAVPVLGTRIGLSGYLGGADQDDDSVGRVTVTIAEADARLEYFQFELRTVGVAIWITGADDLADTTMGTAPGSFLYGGYAEIAYHAAPLLPEGFGHDLVPFLRYEYIDTQARVPAGFDRVRAGRRNIITGGVSYLPHPNVAIKADIEQWWDGDDDSLTRFNLGIGWSY